MTAKLHWSSRSPFVRKVMIVLHETNQQDDIELVDSLVATTLPPNQSVMDDNPLGKIPAYVPEEGPALFDSRVICEYLDSKSGGSLFPDRLPARMQQLRWQAMADGLSDLLLVWRTELNRDGGPWVALTTGYDAKVHAVMHRLESEADQLQEAQFGIGLVSLVCALGQLDFRWPDSGWTERFPKLSALNERLQTRASVQAAPPPVDDESLPAPHPLNFKLD